MYSTFTYTSHENQPQMWENIPLPKTNSLPLNMMVSKFGISKLPGDYFQVRKCWFQGGYQSHG